MQTIFKTGLFKSMVAVAALCLASVSALHADTLFKPFVMAKTPAGDYQAAITSTKSALVNGGFEIVGDYSPYENTHIFAVTNANLLNIAKSEQTGGYAAAQRVSVSNVKGKVQVAFTNPEYMAYAYRFNNDMKTIRTALVAALGFEKDFGAEGLTEKKLRNYNYAWGMEEFDEPDYLAEYSNYAKAVEAVEKGLSKNKVGATKVYRIDIPGKNVTVFGVALKSPNMFNKYQDDGYIMSVIDFTGEKHAAHLPYEILVNGKSIESLNARFRIAMNFPDLSMAGENSFMNIMGAPGGITKALTKVSGGSINDF